MTGPDSLIPLVQASMNGDRGAMQQLLEEVAPTMLAVIRAVFGRGHADTEDLVQESLLAFLKALPSFRWQCTVRHYACRIALQRALDSRRHSDVVGRVHTLLERDAKHDQRSDELPVATSFLNRHHGTLLQALLSEIPSEQSEVLILRHALGYSAEEIAQATGVNANTIRSRLRLAKEAMRRRIEEDERWAELRQETP